MKTLIETIQSGSIDEAQKPVRIWFVIADGSGTGPNGDGTYVNRFKKQEDAEKFAAKSTHLGGRAEADYQDVPKATAARWGF